MVEEYTVHLNAFEGPLDLLLHLIEKNKIDIYDIPIAVLTDQYLTYLDQFREFNIDVASEFLLMAATLLQIKSRILLPEQPNIADEDEIDEDPRQELVQRLLEYRRFKEVSSVLDKMSITQGHIFYRATDLPPIQHLPPENLDVNLLWQAFQNVIEGQLSQNNIQKVARDKFSVQDKMLFILTLLQKTAKKAILFTAAFAIDSTKGEMIVSFLAVLELAKLKRINIKQALSFSPIYIYLRNDNNVL
ncbi:segregation and condensation protein A [Pectinatus frisingensis]|jgi:segregation and condensation protein A|uniref:segregation and condensation protein A n=1 Tax=Pectinatus frisingensis TaxID=865 RepID=UPI0015F567D8|nr:segregation/condensation protein A [Pectinatus frisingensis]